ncbi:hypothetical protein [Aestuariibacter salexigens]|uniref:hypothetical protein n=1 Tax=Aestuariibacter salexigens TaxID=226010 RepID=UPI000427E541|nr:hypothetical protein [Aestuariibacter salexigens]
MKPQYLAAAIGVILIAVVIFFMIDPEPNDLTEDQLKGWQLMKVAQNLCLSGESSMAGFNLQTMWSNQIEVQAGGKAEKQKGAVAYLDEQIRSIQDEQIRACLADFSERIKNCMLDNCNAALLPKTIDFEFKFEPETDLAFVDDKEVFFGLQQRSNNRKLVRQQAGNFVDTIAFPAKNEVVTAWISPATLDSFMGNEKVKFYFTQALKMPEGRKDFTRYSCTSSSGCIWDDETPHILRVAKTPDFTNTVSRYWIAHAVAQQTGSDSWSIPDVEYLKQHADARKIGYTHFVIQANEALPDEANGYYVDISVNGVNALIDGAPGEFHVQDLPAGGSVKYEFGLQNLNFTGVNSGCDTIQVLIQGMRDGRKAGQPVTLTRSYVALRDAAMETIEAGGQQWQWHGRYVRANTDYDYEVFIASRKVSDDLVFERHIDAISNTVDTMNNAKRIFDAAGLKYEDTPLVAVIRPPLTKISYGLAVGIVEPNGQVRFTLEKKLAYDIADYLLTARNQSRELRQVINKDKYIYKVRGDSDHAASPRICPGQGVV